MPSTIEYRWRGPVIDAEMMNLITAHGDACGSRARQPD
jgi:hypothetical protein